MSLTKYSLQITLLTNHLNVIILKPMLVSIKWLKELVEFDLTPKDLADLFVSKGIEINSISRIGDKLEGFIVTEVKQIENNKVTIFDGKSTFNINTIAYRLKIGDKIGYNPTNTKWVNPATIGISEDTLPYVLNKEYAVGLPVLNYLDDYTLDLEILPNRGDLMSITGIARELMSYDEKFKKAEISEIVSTGETSNVNVNELLTLQVDKKGCPDYIARIISDIKIAPSPFWLQWRLIACGLRPINNIVDATNYIMLKYGTPLHAFDYDRVADKTINVRFANKNEKIKIIDNEVKNLNEKVLLIADSKFPVAIAGIMGGLDSEISPTTKRVLLECARFDPKTIRRGSKAINLTTEASKRFEMGIDSDILETASVEVSNLIADLGNGAVIKDKLEVRTAIEPTMIKLDIAKTNKLLGIKLSDEKISNILSNLGCEIKQDNKTLTVKIPSYRLDLTRDVDLIEELGRIYGYDKLPSEYTIRGNKTGGIDSMSIELSNIRNFFTGLGFIECYTVSFCDEAIVKEFVDNNIVHIPTPLNERYAVMRPSILVTLLDSVKNNYSRGNKDLRLFEIGKIFKNDKEPSETVNITALILGQNIPTFWQKSQITDTDFFDIKGVAESFLAYLKIEEISFVKSNIKFLVSHNAMQIKYADKFIGTLGEIKKTVLNRFDIPVPVYALELELEALIKLSPSYRYFQPLPRFPSIIRDFAFIVDDNISAASLTEEIKKITGALLEQVEVFDYFKGKQLPEGKCNLGIRISLRSEERTLNQTEVNKIFERILHILKEKWQIELRG